MSEGERLEKVRKQVVVPIDDAKKDANNPPNGFDVGTLQLSPKSQRVFETRLGCHLHLFDISSFIPLNLINKHSSTTTLPHVYPSDRSHPSGTAWIITSLAFVLVPAIESFDPSQR